jgi:Ca2+-binding EF-hand superfamily protein
MMISGIGSSNYYMGQMSALGSRFASSQMSSQVKPGPGMDDRPDPVEIFSKMDQDNSAGLDQTEFQVLADKIAEATGHQLDAEEVFATYDADGDGFLSEAETETAMEANRPEGPPPGGMMGAMGGLQGSSPPDLAQMFSDADEDENGSLDETEAQGLADIISGAAGIEMAVEELLATYDEDGDGALSEAETVTALEANRPEEPLPGPSHDTTDRSQEIRSPLSGGIESYLKMAVLTMGQNQVSNTFSGYGPFARSSAGDTTSMSGGFFSVNARA